MPFPPPNEPSCGYTGIKRARLFVTRYVTLHISESCDCAKLYRLRLRDSMLSDNACFFPTSSIDSLRSSTVTSWGFSTSGLSVVDAASVFLVLREVSSMDLTSRKAMSPARIKTEISSESEFEQHQILANH
ncbi:hypothetical protein RvY_14171 [Ramazzottius varieornatus]|uniref:Uncharacterized protein n=1 Tax=Ramazzottius varieornatus TaxID=947166 RepID=A0A1D1VQF3_RAMVA|nr:hypothetical protein RvY_14171 [Ramazzottius varieornatus]